MKAILIAGIIFDSLSVVNFETDTIHIEGEIILQSRIRLHKGKKKVIVLQQTEIFFSHCSARRTRARSLQPLLCMSQQGRSRSAKQRKPLNPKLFRKCAIAPRAAAAEGKITK